MAFSNSTRRFIPLLTISAVISAAREIGGDRMARKDTDEKRNEEVNRAFEQQQRWLNRKWTRNAVSGLVLLIIIAVVLQFTPYRDAPREAFEAALSWAKGFSSGSKHVEPNPQYW